MKEPPSLRALTKEEPFLLIFLVSLGVIGAFVVIDFIVTVIYELIQNGFDLSR